MVKIELINIRKSYGDNIVLDKVSFTIQPQKVNIILGPSGCGKSTLLSIIAGLDHNFQGTIKGIDQRKLSYVFQEDCLLEWRTVKENIIYALSGKVEREKFINYAKVLGLSDYFNYFPYQLSGGLRQRVNLLRAFLYPSSLLLMDEPFKSLDIQSKEEAIGLFLRIQKERKITAVLVTHTLDEALQLGSWIHILSSKPTRLLNTLINPFIDSEEIYSSKDKELFLTRVEEMLQNPL